MSFTTTIEQHTENWKSGTILLTPSKRQRADPTPLTSDLWKWTLTHEAIAPCFVQDVFKMREHEDLGKSKLSHIPWPRSTT